MELNRIHSNGRRHSNLILIPGVGLLLVFSVCFLAACGTSSQLENPQQTALRAVKVADSLMLTTTVTTVPTVSPEPTSSATSAYPPTPDPNGKSEFATMVAEHDIEILTAVALEPTQTPGELPVYPTETPRMGLFSACPGTSSLGPQCNNAWREVINGEIVQVDAGREGWDGDRSQGLLMVINWNQHTRDIYRTPQRVGDVQIVSVEGMMITVAVAQSPWATATPGTTFVFDLATRQWVTTATATPNPSPSASVPLLPSVSPLSSR